MILVEMTLGLGHFGTSDSMVVPNPDMTQSEGHSQSRILMKMWIFPTLQQFLDDKAWSKQCLVQGVQQKLMLIAAKLIRHSSRICVTFIGLSLLLNLLSHFHDSYIWTSRSLVFVSNICNHLLTI